MAGRLLEIRVSPIVGASWEAVEDLKKVK